MGWSVTRGDVEVFRSQLWKDERSFPRAADTKQIFIKDCFRRDAAEREFAALSLLRSLGDEPLCPAPVEVLGSNLAMTAIDGMRLFEVLRGLREIELSRRDGAADRARGTLVARQRQRLARIQIALLENQDQFEPVIYPLEEKVRSLLELLARVLGIVLPPEPELGLAKLGDYWETSCGQVPFRDATPKNTLVTHALFDWDMRRGMDEADAVSRLLDSMDASGWNDVGLMDVDFTSVEHLTAVEDDPISLHFHEWTIGSCAADANALLLLPAYTPVDPYRTAAAMLVRYLRFGGRKLAYRLINCAGFEVRFRYDDPLFYFRRIRNLVEMISPAFADDFPVLLNFVHRIGAVAGDPGPSDKTVMKIDHFRSVYGHGGDYWSENPSS